MNKTISKAFVYFIVISLTFTFIVHAEDNQKIPWLDKNKDGYDDVTGLNKNRYASNQIPIPLSTTEFKLKKGTYTTEEGVTLTVSGDTKVARNSDGSFSIGGSKVTGYDISYNKGQYSFSGDGSLDNIYVSNVRNVHYTLKNDESAIIMGEAGDEPSTFDKNTFKPRGTVFRFERIRSMYSYEMNFLTDTELVDLDSGNRMKQVTIKAAGGKVTLPSGHVLEKGSVTFQGGGYVIRDSATIDGVSIKKIESPYGLIEPIKFSTSSNLPPQGTFVHMDKDNFVVRMDTEKSFQSLFIKMEDGNPYMPKGLSFLVDNDGGLDIKKDEQKDAPFVRAFGKTSIWDDRFLLRSNGKDVKVYANNLLEASQSSDLEVEFTDLDGKRLMPENLKIMEGSMVTKDLIVNSMGFDRKKHNIQIIPEYIDQSIITTIMPELTDAVKRMPEQSILQIYVQLMQARQFERMCPPGSAACAPGNFLNLQLGGNLRSDTIHHELSHIYNYINDVSNKPIYEDKSLTYMWNLVSGDVFGKGYISDSGTADNKNHREDIAEVNTWAKYSKDNLVSAMGEDPRYNLKLKLLVAANPPLMTEEQYEYAAGQPHTKISKEELLEVLKFQEKLRQLTSEGKVKLAQLRKTQ